MNDFLDSSDNGLSEIERKRHLVTRDLLTAQSGMPKIEVDKLYKAELERVNSARVRDFLPILIGRKLKHDLLKNH